MSPVLFPPETKITLTDLAPDTSFSSNSPNVAYDPRPVDARNIPADLNGAQVVYGSFHHFAPEDARAILAAAAGVNEPIAIFEGTERSAKGLAVCLLIPILVLIMMPLTSPPRFLSLFFTYLIPILPLIILWDGIVSTLRSYTQEEMRALTASLTSYEWNAGTLLGPHQERITYLLGSPRQS